MFLDLDQSFYKTRINSHARKICWQTCLLIIRELKQATMATTTTTPRNKRFKKESTRRSSNNRTKPLYQDYLHHIANFCVTVLTIFSEEINSNNTKCRQRILKFIWSTWKYWWNENDEILPVFAQFLWTLKFILSSSYRKLFLVLFQVTIYTFISIYIWSKIFVH